MCALAAKNAGQDDPRRSNCTRQRRFFQEACRSSISGGEVGLATPFRDRWWELAAAQILRREAWQAITGQSIADEQAWLHLICARSYRALGDPQKAEEELAAAVPKDSSDVQILQARADLLQAWGETERAEADWRRIVATAGEDPAPWIHCGRFYAAIGKPEQAAMCFAEAIAPNGVKRPPLAAIPFSPEKAARHQRAWADHLGVPVEFENSLGMKFRLIPPGSFDMGIPPEERLRIVVELNRQGTPDFHVRPFEEEGLVRVFLSAPYYLAQCEVTVQQFRKFVEDTGHQTDGEKQGIGGFAGRKGEWVLHPSHVWTSPSERWELKDNQPAVHISWNDATAFCNWLSRKESKLCTLPTEAQWEFACRGGSSTLFGAGDDPSVLEEIAWTKKTRRTAGVQFANRLARRRRIRLACTTCWATHSNGARTGMPPDLPAQFPWSIPGIPRSPADVLLVVERGFKKMRRTVADTESVRRPNYQATPGEASGSPLWGISSAWRAPRLWRSQHHARPSKVFVQKQKRPVRP